MDQCFCVCSFWNGFATTKAIGLKLSAYLLRVMDLYEPQFTVLMGASHARVTVVHLSSRLEIYLVTTYHAFCQQIFCEKLINGTMFYYTVQTHFMNFCYVIFTARDGKKSLVQRR